MDSPAEWIAHKNIEHFERLLESEADPNKLAQLQALLEEERNRLAALLPPGRE